MKYGIRSGCGQTFNINQNPFERWQKRVIYGLGGGIIGFIICFFIGIAGTVCGFPFTRRADWIGGAIGAKMGFDLADKSSVTCPHCNTRMKA
jgi:hypothetical protein